MACQITNPVKDACRKSLPPWLRKRLVLSRHFSGTSATLKSLGVTTVCKEAKCPNQFECFSNRTATFLIMGSRCTRNCRFCNVDHGACAPPDPEEPVRVAEAARRMKLKYVVVTSVTRDDLSDGGASIFAETIRQLRREIPDVMIEVLIPDFQGDYDALKTVLDARPDVLNHNIETVARLYDTVRPQAIYERSLELLRRAKEYAPDIPGKSGIMLGLGETDDEIRQTLQDLYDSGCRFLTMGQYLQPSKSHLPVERFVTPEEFDAWRETALEIGYTEVASGPFVRSSYHAKDLYQNAASRSEKSACCAASH